MSWCLLSCVRLAVLRPQGDRRVILPPATRSGRAPGVQALPEKHLSGAGRGTSPSRRARARQSRAARSGRGEPQGPAEPRRVAVPIPPRHVGVREREKRGGGVASCHAARRALGVDPGGNKTTTGPSDDVSLSGWLSVRLALSLPRRSRPAARLRLRERHARGGREGSLGKKSLYASQIIEIKIRKI